MIHRKSLEYAKLKVNGLHKDDAPALEISLTESDEVYFNILNARPVLPKKLFNPKKLMLISMLFFIFFFSEMSLKHVEFTSDFIKVNKNLPWKFRIWEWLIISFEAIYFKKFSEIYKGNKIFNNLRISLGLKMRLWTLPISKKLKTFKLNFIKNSIICCQSSRFLNKSKTKVWNLFQCKQKWKSVTNLCTLIVQHTKVFNEIFIFLQTVNNIKSSLIQQVEKRNRWAIGRIILDASN